MANQQTPKQHEPKRKPGVQSGGRDHQSSPRGTPGKNPQPAPLPGDEPDVQSDVIAEKDQERQRQGDPGAGAPSSSDKPRYGNTGGNRSGGQDHR